jgi:hypothetical protein
VGTQGQIRKGELEMVPFWPDSGPGVAMIDQLQKSNLSIYYLRATKVFVLMNKATMNSREAIMMAKLLEKGK